jgi:predicted TIM-barrel fold metal-dependent hydrolase
MPVIDADAHVVETERTWDFIPKSDQHLRPIIVTQPDASGKPVRYWLVDGKIRNTARQPIGQREDWDPSRVPEEMHAYSKAAGRDTDTPDASRHMEDVGARLRHMDELGIDIQFLYPTIFLRRLAERPEVQVALCKGYNRWLADIWSQSEGRLRWAAVLPFGVMDEALEELRWVAEYGARGVFMRGVEEAGMLHDPYFFPIYEEMSRLDMPVTVHIGNGNPEMERILNHGKGGSPFSSLRMASVAACHSWILAGIPQEFPELRIGFVEASSQWVPYMVKDLNRRFPARHGRPAPDDLMRESRVWVTCETDDDLEYVLGYTGEDNLMIGTDYGHTDQSSEIMALRNLREQGKVPPGVVEKMLDSNPRAFYGF